MLCLARQMGRRRFFDGGRAGQFFFLLSRFFLRYRRARLSNIRGHFFSKLEKATSIQYEAHGGRRQWCRAPHPAWDLNASFREKRALWVFYRCCCPISNGKRPPMLPPYGKVRSPMQSRKAWARYARCRLHCPASNSSWRAFSSVGGEVLLKAGDGAPLLLVGFLCAANSRDSCLLTSTDPAAIVAVQNAGWPYRLRCSAFLLPLVIARHYARDGAVLILAQGVAGIDGRHIGGVDQHVCRRFI